MSTLFKASPEDYRIVADIGSRTFYETWKEVNTEEDLQSYISEAFDEKKIRNELENAAVNTFILARVDKEIAGFVKLRNDRIYEGLTGTKSLEIERIYLLKIYQDKKIGKALMDESIRLAKVQQYEWLWLGVNQENYKAIDFYKRYGFEIFGKKQFRLGKAVDEDFLMKLRVGGNWVIG